MKMRGIIGRVMKRISGIRWNGNRAREARERRAEKPTTRSLFPNEAAAKKFEDIEDAMARGKALQWIEPEKRSTALMFIRLRLIGKPISPEMEAMLKGLTEDERRHIDGFLEYYPET